MTDPESTRERVLRVAMQLFGERGYAATTIEQIEAGAGFSPGSGSLYRHFRSKRALLEEGVRAQLDGAAALRTAMEGPDGQDGSDDLDALPLRERLDAAFALTIARLDRGRDVVRMLLRDYREFPDVLDRLREEAMTRFHESFSAWLAAQPELDGRDRDVPAVAAVVVAALSHYWFLRDSFGTPPFAMDEQRFVGAVADLTIAALGATAGAERAP
jgi:AcrR family transcriptional regulator